MATVLLGTVSTVQNLNKRVKRKKKEKKKKKLTKLPLQLQFCTVKYVGYTVPNHCSGIAAFYILRDKGSLKELHVICKSTRSSSFHDQDAC